MEAPASLTTQLEATLVAALPVTRAPTAKRKSTDAAAAPVPMVSAL